MSRARSDALQLCFDIQVDMNYPEQLNLSWNEFEKCASNTFKELLEETDFVDVTLVSDDLFQLKAHKVILSSCSSVLKKILQVNPQQHPIIYLAGIPYKEMKGLINFMYLGQTEINEEDLNIFMDAAAILDIRGLNKEIKHYERRKEIENQMKNFVDNTDAFIHTKDVETFENTMENDYKTELEDAMYTKTNNFKCEQCNYTSHYSHHIKRHKDAAHSGIRFPCDICDDKFSFSHSLTRHKKRKHSRI